MPYNSFLHQSASDGVCTLLTGKMDRDHTRCSALDNLRIGLSEFKLEKWVSGQKVLRSQLRLAIRLHIRLTNNGQQVDAIGIGCLIKGQFIRGVNSRCTLLMRIVHVGNCRGQEKKIPQPSRIEHDEREAAAVNLSFQEALHKGIGFKTKLAFCRERGVGMSTRKAVKGLASNSGRRLDNLRADPAAPIHQDIIWCANRYNLNVCIGRFPVVFHSGSAPAVSGRTRTPGMAAIRRTNWW